MSYDSECYRLAQHFLDDTKAPEIYRHHLAQHIQRAIEDWLESELPTDSVKP